MKKILLTTAFAVAAACAANAQATKTDGWKIISNYNLNFANAGFSTYQAAGGQNNITIAGLVDVNATKPIGKGKWDNALTLAYGANRIGSVTNGAAFKKIDDRILLTSAYTQKLRDLPPAVCFAHSSTKVLKHQKWAHLSVYLTYLHPQPSRQASVPLT
jgi:hypothetical protein